MLNISTTDSGLFKIEKDGVAIFRKRKPNLRWDKIWLEKAESYSRLTRCLTRGAGSVIVKDYRFDISGGFNGPPMGTKHPEERYPECAGVCPRRHFGYGSGEGLWICTCGHAERSAVAIAARNGQATEDKTMYLYTNPPVLPCLECATVIIQAGISEFVVDTDQSYQDKDHAVDILELFKEANILVRRPLMEEF